MEMTILTSEELPKNKGRHKKKHRVREQADKCGKKQGKKPFYGYFFST